MRDKGRDINISVTIHLQIKHLFQTGLNVKKICWIIQPGELFILISLGLFLCDSHSYALHCVFF